VLLSLMEGVAGDVLGCCLARWKVLQEMCLCAAELDGRCCRRCACVLLSLMEGVAGDVLGRRCRRSSMSPDLPEHVVKRETLA